MAESDAYHYRVILRALDEIAAAPAPLSLDALAGRLGLSPAHFQRVFSRWAGVSPKHYQQYLALDHARRLLRARHGTLETSAAAGLSGAGRLHDLFIKWEAMAPGAYARAGDGIEIAWAWQDSPFGPMLAMATDRGLCGIAFAAVRSRDTAFADLAARWPAARYRADPAMVTPLAEAALTRRGARLHVFGGPFQHKVWEALLQVPDGHVTTYGDIAARIGRPGAARAVGTAVGRNPLGWIIPCHRALRRDGALGGYHWGVPVKRAMLAYEAARTGAE